jgi:hypothetical protein
MLKYLRERRQRRLFREWVNRAGLDPEEIPEEEEAEEPALPVEQERQYQRLYQHLPYVLLGFLLGVVCTSLALVVVRSC